MRLLWSCGWSGVVHITLLRVLLLPSAFIGLPIAGPCPGEPLGLQPVLAPTEAAWPRAAPGAAGRGRARWGGERAGSRLPLKGRGALGPAPGQGPCPEPSPAGRGLEGQLSSWAKLCQQLQPCWAALPALGPAGHEAPCVPGAAGASDTPLSTGALLPLLKTGKRLQPGTTGSVNLHLHARVPLPCHS